MDWNDEQHQKLMMLMLTHNNPEFGQQPIQQEGIGSMIGSLFGYNSAPAGPEVIQGEQNAKFPGPSEIEVARDADAGYGTGNEAFMEGRAANVLSNPPRTANQQREAVSGAGNDLDLVVNPKFGGIVPGNTPTADLYTAGHLAAQRSPIAGLGYDPRHFNLDTKSGPTSTAGAYEPKDDNGYVNANYGSTIVHESTHRGLELLRRQGLIPDSLMKRLPDEESIVRYVMATTMGDPENERGDIAQKQRNQALYTFGRNPVNPNQIYTNSTVPSVRDKVNALSELNAIAAKYYLDRRPGGPR